MAPSAVPTRFTLAMALVIFALAALWLNAAPDTLHPAADVTVAALLTALAAITMKSSMSARATATLATLIPKSDMLGSTGCAPAVDQGFYAPRMR